MLLKLGDGVFHKKGGSQKGGSYPSMDRGKYVKVEGHKNIIISSFSNLSLLKTSYNQLKNTLFSANNQEFCF